MKILKFGGTSVANADNIKKVIDIAKKSSKNNPIIVVVSALGGTTDILLQAGIKAEKKDNKYLSEIESLENRHIFTVQELIKDSHQDEVISQVRTYFNQLVNILEGIYLINEFSNKTKDKIASFGEILSSYIISEAMKSQGVDAILKNAQELIITDESYTNAKVDFKVTEKNIQDFYAKNESPIVVVPGFVASTSKGENSTLGRGGSDYTASIFAKALNVTELEIWTDVSGMFTANPKLVKQAKPIKHISYQEAMELSHFGAKVLFPPTIQPVLEQKIPIRIKNTFDPGAEGTLITQNTNGNTSPAKGISHIENISLLTVEGSGMIGVPGFTKRILGTLSDANINVSLVTQSSSEHFLCMGIDSKDVTLAEKLFNKAFKYEMSQGIMDPLIIENNLAIIALVGDNMKSHQGISGKMFSTLGSNNVNIRAIAQGASEKNITAVIERKDAVKALNTLHNAFFEGDIKQLNLFVVGVGNVGGKLLEQIHMQQQYLIDEQHLDVRVIAVTNSKKMHFDTEGINLDNWKESLKEKGDKLDLEKFFKNVKSLNYRNSIFVDNTANAKISTLYADYLKNSIAVVTCNKIACSSEYENYQNLKFLARKYDAPFLFETNVGAGLPIIDTLKNLIMSGDKVTKIQAVLSGSLNFIFNEFNSQTSFHDVVVEAGVQGFTEPDPRIDLSGVDVMRKILILARESGNVMELDDIKNESFLPQSSLDADSVADFMATLEPEATHFKAISEAAEKENCRLKYVAEFDNGKAKVGLQHIPSDHPFYNLDGSDNIVLFFTERYSQQPLIIKGAGAGAAVTASGLFADIIRIGNK
ncbi:bifunctional aspartate kinase/homoserine dehydrogenase I [Urechidicola croceus]|uniref:Bifunctional aspartate kinase/homoserine dehydrogenase I n=1 Tax=Urechidicola croceus TaxID=1850246 RepID=A0A1D8P5L6_9FLAO|nr:bifunctional aspartate kinase/homoserine dehydrogenase I [Urechidicola croceus]AOW19847.1 bifunctional aspartate kinase/homoserine dehydrogenase I [Urechidicola croceus]